MSHNPPAASRRSGGSSEWCEPQLGLSLHHWPFHPLSFLGTTLEQNGGWLGGGEVLRGTRRKVGGRGGKDPAGLRRGQAKPLCRCQEDTPCTGDDSSGRGRWAVMWARRGGLVVSVSIFIAMSTPEWSHSGWIWV